MQIQFFFDRGLISNSRKENSEEERLWNNLKDKVVKTGIRNSLLVAPMPTASTSQILGNNECIEPFTSNVYTRRTLAGEHVVINKYLIEDLLKLGLWDDEMKQRILFFKGSVQKISSIPHELRNIYKTSWELKQKVIIDMAIDRGKFICQSQSLNLFMESPSFKKLTSMHFYAWENGLKTTYYLRGKAATRVEKSTVSFKLAEEPETEEIKACSILDPECESCQ